MDVTNHQIIPQVQLSSEMGGKKATLIHSLTKRRIFRDFTGSLFGFDVQVGNCAAYVVFIDLNIMQYFKKK